MKSADIPRSTRTFLRALLRESEQFLFIKLSEEARDESARTASVESRLAAHDSAG